MRGYLIQFACTFLLAVALYFMNDNAAAVLLCAAVLMPLAAILICALTTSDKSIARTVLETTTLLLWLALAWALLVAATSYIPPGICIAIAAVVGVLWLTLYLTRGRPKDRSQAWAATGHCAVCGYDLRSSAARCPECGAAITGELDRRRRVRRYLLAKRTAEGAAATKQAVQARIAVDFDAVSSSQGADPTENTSTPTNDVV